MRTNFEFSLISEEAVEEFTAILKENEHIKMEKKEENINLNLINYKVVVDENYTPTFKDWLQKSRDVFPVKYESTEFYVYHLENLNTGTSSLEVFGDRDSIPSREHLLYELYTEKVFNSYEEAKSLVKKYDREER